MAQVDQVTQRNASAAEELSSTAEEMSSQAEALLQTIGFFRVRESTHAVRGFSTHAPTLPAPRPAAQAPVAPKLSLPHPVVAGPKGNGAPTAEGGFKKF
jgi:methyl-accepting chemotaxis protein